MAKRTPEQQKLIDKQLKYCGLDKWHEAGFIGVSHTTNKPIAIWNMESETSDHGDATEDSAYLAMPGGIVHTAPLQGSLKLSYNVQYKGEKYTPEEFIRKFGIKILTRSIGGKAESGDTPEANYWNDLGDRYKLIAFNSIGNEGSKGASASLPAAFAFYICAGGLNDKGVFNVKYYSSRDPEADYITFTNFREGTSFSGPFLAGTTGDIVGRYDDDMSKEEAGAYLTMIALDIGKPGKDNESGDGIPIVPAPERKFITMTVGSAEYQIDGAKKDMDTIPININGNVLVPIRFVAEALGSAVNWDEEIDTATIIDENDTPDKADDVTIKLTLGSKTALVDDDSDGIYDAEPLNVAPFRDKNGRTLAPLRFVAEQLGCNVAWVQKYQKVLILEGVRR